MPDVDTDDQVDKRLELIRRFTLASFADTSLFNAVPQEVLLFLSLDDDSDVVREIAAGTESAQHGQNVYFHHVRVANLPT